MPSDQPRSILGPFPPMCAKCAQEPEFVRLVRDKLAHARVKHGPIRSPHEGLAVILEEYHELQAEVFKQQAHRSLLAKELIDIAAVCQRMAEDLQLLITPEPGEPGFCARCFDPRNTRPHTCGREPRPSPRPHPTDARVLAGVEST